MTDPAQTPGVSPPVAVAFATTGFVALLIMGLGMLSLALDADVIGVPGLGQVPGITGTVLAVAAFAASLWPWVRRRPHFAGSLVCAVAVFLAYPAGIWGGAVLSGADTAAAAAAAGGVATGWTGLVVASAGLVAAGGGIALVRRRRERPRWPWEDPFDE